MAGGKVKRIGAATTTIVGTAWFASWLYQVTQEKADRKKFSPPGQLIDVDGRRIHVTRMGDKKPIVVVLPWLGGCALEWFTIQKSLASHATVYVVDRAGLGWSEPSRGPQTPHRIVRDLHAVLNALPITEPVILVGHSYGGLSARLYAARHPQRVKALALVESSHENQYQELSRFPGQEAIIWWTIAIKDRLKWLGLQRLKTDIGLNKKLMRKAEEKYTREFRDIGLAQHFRLSHRRADAQEMIGMTCGNRSVRREAQHHDDLPITVVTAGIGGRTKAGFYETWLKLQNSFFSLSTNTNQVWAPENGHSVHLENPELVAQAIKDLIDRLPRSTGENSRAHHHEGRYE